MVFPLNMMRDTTILILLNGITPWIVSLMDIMLLLKLELNRLIIRNL